MHKIECAKLKSLKKPELYAVKSIYEATNVRMLLKVIAKHTQLLSLTNKVIYLSCTMKQIVIRAARKIKSICYRMRYYLANERKTSVTVSFEKFREEKQLTNSSLSRSEG